MDDRIKPATVSEKFNHLPRDPTHAHADVRTSPMAVSQSAPQHIYERRSEKMDPSDVAEYKSVAATSSCASWEVASR